ncbi:hypothetical protein ACFWJW_30850 [Streptomyces sp. NPDC127097]|uniref:hypothetical protein n=1 Tax=Streptomyces sp. NPDC127097 TaxID=3347136 RepID=UPI003668EA13
MDSRIYPHDSKWRLLKGLWVSPLPPPPPSLIFLIGAGGALAISTSVLVAAAFTSGYLTPWGQRLFGAGALIALTGAAFLLIEISHRRRRIFSLYQSGLDTVTRSTRNSREVKDQLAIVEMSLIATGAYKEASDLRNELRRMGVLSGEE